MKKSILILAMLFFCGMLVGPLKAQQVPQFSQYIFNPVFINPAYTGYKESLFVQSYYRTQWTGVEGAPTTFAVAADTYLEGSKLGIGFYALHDELGPQRATSMFANISYRIQLTESQFLNFGIAGGMVNSMFDGSILNPLMPTDPSVPLNQERVMYPEFKAGMFYYSDFFFFGAAAENMLSLFREEDQGDIIVDRRLAANLHTGFFLNLSDQVGLIPSVLVMDDFRAPARVDVNVQGVFYERLRLGASYRFGVDYADRLANSNLERPVALIGIAQLQLGEGLRIGYAYDHNISGFDVRSLTTHEISLGILFPQRRSSIVSPRYF